MPQMHLYDLKLRNVFAKRKEKVSTIESIYLLAWVVE